MAQVDVVQRRSGDRRGDDRDLHPIEGGENGGQRRRAVGHPAVDLPAVHRGFADPGDLVQSRGDPVRESAVGNGRELQVDGVTTQLALEFVRAAFDEDAAVVDDGDLGCKPVGLLQVVGGEQDRQPVRGE